MKIPEGVTGVVMIGLDEENYVHILSYVEEDVTRDLLLDALDILNEKGEGVANLH